MTQINPRCAICENEALTEEELVELRLWGQHILCQERGWEGVEFYNARKNDL